MIKHRWIQGNSEGLTDAHNIRHIVFVVGQNVPLERERIAEEETKATHLVLYADDMPVATGRILVADGKFTLGRIAVLEEYRGQGLGKLVTQMLAEKCFKMGADIVVLSSQLHAKGFYESLGFVSYGDIYMDAGIQHVSMKKISKNS
ncbi:MAG: GNAT family N-acetyltransferase [Defluviitaleaceae bacterium]|nr:GNAT family N-acetyltransferase [Defluviitaleaceae bacterium]